MPLQSQVTVRAPQQLIDAVDERASLAGIKRADVVRCALAREVERPIDKRSRATVEEWLAGESLATEDEHDV
jgi:predicted transcriptional regulator